MQVPHNQNINYALFSINITSTLNKNLANGNTEKNHIIHPTAIIYWYMRVIQ